MKKNINGGQPNAEDFVLVKDEKGKFLYYYSGRYYSYDEAKRFLSPAEAEKLVKLPQKKEAPKKPEPEAAPEKLEELPPEKRSIEEKVLTQSAEKIIGNSGLEVAVSDKDKLIKLIITRFRRVRKDLEIKYVLTSARESGGLGLDEQKAEMILSEIQKALPEIEKKRLAIMRGEFLLIETEKVTLPTPASPAREAGRKNLSGLDDSRPVMTEVTPAIMGPLDEMRTMDLVNLRRLGSSKDEIVNEIMEKVNLLGEESAQKKYEAIIAWQRSPVYQLYTNLAFESIKENKPVAEIIALKAGEGKETLSQDEFQAILELNSKLQY
ncbi:MAG TPA: hypothetical protein VMX18_02480 [Candidatus Bipolaricaulota bacterium]|nr:hypothetical protein [Candidatus Bipolaricaulota bacterium]